MKVVITGGTGFVGRHLSAALLARGDSVVALARSPQPADFTHPLLTCLQADTTRGGPWQDELADAGAVVNLAGVSIFKRWNSSVKALIRSSRIETTRRVVEALPAGCGPTLLSASGAGYYGDRGEEALTEASPAGDDFMAGVAADWEAAAVRAQARGARVVLARFGVVLGRGGGAMAQMIPAFRMFCGGPLGSGRQWFPWIHLSDLVAAALFAIDHPGLSGAVNFTAPQPARLRVVAKALGKALQRPALLPAPALMVRLALGEFAGVLLGSQRVTPQKLPAAGFRFAYPDIRSAVAEIVSVPAPPDRKDLKHA
jgi:uncharacterized protein (TIGR01777 family)